jgi:hypothetical protein
MAMIDEIDFGLKSLGRKCFKASWCLVFMAAIDPIKDNLLNKITDFFIPRPIVDFLNREIFVRSWIWFNNWSFVHFGAGLIFALFFPMRLWTWVIINIVFEIIEYVLAFGGHPLFVEEAIDIAWDLIFSVGGFLIVSKLRRKFGNVSSGK